MINNDTNLAAKVGRSWWATTKNLKLKMQRLFATLSEKDRRRYAAVEAAKLGHGGIDYISKLFDIDPKTVRRGLRDLEQTDDPALQRVRKPGGGRKSATEHDPRWKTTFCSYWPNLRRVIRCGKACCGQTSPAATSVAVCGRWAPPPADIRFVSL